MHTHSVEPWRHDHVFLGAEHDRNEKRTLAVVALTAAMMAIEIVGGALFGSMALVADGWHMATHVVALGVAAAAYRFARRHANNRRFSFGTGKLGDLAAFASAIMLGMIALYIGAESATRLLHPVAIRFAEAIPIAVVGLAVNVASVWLLHEGAHGHGSHNHHHDHHHHSHGHGAHDGAHDHRHNGHGHHDTNLRAAYVHVLADALTSVLAIVALVGARLLGLTWLDPVMGLVGTVVIAAWAFSLVRSAGAVLLDVAPADDTEAEIRHRLELNGDRVSDLHLWQLGPGHRAAVLSIVTDHPQQPETYKVRLLGLPQLSHVTVEVLHCPDHALTA